MRPTGRDAAALVTAIAVALALGELALRTLAPQRTGSTLLAWSPAMFAPSDHLPYALRPGFAGRLVREEFDVAIEINAHGFRDEELRPAPHGLRVLALGDSFTFGWGVEAEESWPERLERQIAPAEVVNAGFASGYSPDTAYVFLRERGTALRPDLVLHGFFLGNDVDRGRSADTRWVGRDAFDLPNAVENVSSRIEAGRLVRAQRRLRYRVPLLRDSHLFQLASLGVRRARGALGPPGPLPLFRSEWSAETLDRIERVERLFAGMQRLCAASGARFAIVAIPSLEQVRPEAAGVPEGVDPDRITRHFAAFAEARGIAFVDLSAELREASAERALYYARDEHWNAAGHALAAGALARELRARGLVPAT